MLYNPPTGGAANDPYVGKNVAAGIQGSKVPPGAVEFPQREIMSVISAAISAGLQITPTNTDLTQLLQSIEYLIPKYTPAQVAQSPLAGAGMAVAVDGRTVSLDIDNLPVETSISANDKIAFYTEESEDGLTAGTPFAATLSAISTYILGQAPASTKYGATSDAGLALDGNNNFGLAPSNLPFSDSVGDTDRTYLARNGGGAFLATLADVASYVLAKAASAQYQGSFGTAGSGYAIFEAFNPPLILQWTLYGGSGHGPFNVPFPITFPNQVFAMFATDSANQNGSGSGCYSYGLDFSNTSQAQIFSSAGSGVAWHTRLFALGC